MQLNDHLRYFLIGLLAITSVSSVYFAWKLSPTVVEYIFYVALGLGLTYSLVVAKQKNKQHKLQMIEGCETPSW